MQGKNHSHAPRAVPSRVCNTAIHKLEVLWIAAV